jgi:hypothetical protein
MNMKKATAVTTLSMEAEDGQCGFVMVLRSSHTELDVRNITPNDMVRQLRQMAIDLPLHLEQTAASVEAKNAVGQATRVQ